MAQDDAPRHQRSRLGAGRWRLRICRDRETAVRTDLLDYELPERLIARHPPEERSAAAMLVVGAGLVHTRVRELARLLEPGALLVVNDTRVMPARLYGRKASGGRVELLLVRLVEERGPMKAHWSAMVRSGKALRESMEIIVDETLSARIVRGRDEAGLATVALESRGRTVAEAIARAGKMPLPPYLRREAEPADVERYQTVFARVLGAVAAPTAGLHFDQELLGAIAARGVELATVTLHVGPGTFQPVSVDDLDEHRMHAEEFAISESTAKMIAQARARGASVVAVGTTVVRALESSHDPERAGHVRPTERAETRL
ncbi:MAG: S-adenosylmethionine:tRNA ribosyltransferase-isomerase, partial [Myxococcales bacterium]|nr:S-adenosylmethionine:tRNA ribosyltransferase-isomerase [Myxococcales bacterium]